MKRAGRLGDALLAESFQLSDRLKPRVALYRATAESRGRPHKVVLFREGYVAPTREEASREYEAGLLSTHRYYWRHGSYYQDIKKEEDLDLRRISLDRLILGSPEDCIEKVQMWTRDIGADYFLIRFRHPAGPAHEKVLRALQLFGETVIPRFR
jgi:alkanesulfonate monooxygenase SsuD/methylene tetrahydromethanopterin reductase-like flavin-dependent oxidoreductase (luciferase family)